MDVIERVSVDNNDYKMGVVDNELLAVPALALETVLEDQVVSETEDSPLQVVADPVESVPSRAIVKRLYFKKSLGTMASETVGQSLSFHGASG